MIAPLLFKTIGDQVSAACQGVGCGACQITPAVSVSLADRAAPTASLHSRHRFLEFEPELAGGDPR
jgi:hypothetical protein